MVIEIKSRYRFKAGRAFRVAKVVLLEGPKVHYDVFEVSDRGDDRYVDTGEMYQDTFEQLVNNGYFQKLQTQPKGE